MNNLKELPSVDISIRDYEDEDTGRIIFHPIIRANAGAYSCGAIALTALEDLFLVREAIDRFIISNNITPVFPVNKNEEEQAAPKYAAIIGGYLAASGFKPMNRANFKPKGMNVRTSQEIILDLADMVDLSLNDVADAMLHLGYCTVMAESKVGWLLGRADDTVCSGD